MIRSIRDSPPSAAPKSTPRSYRAQGVVHRLHSVAGVFVAPLLLVAALTGLLYAVAPTLETWIYRDALTAESGLPPQPVADQITRAKEVHPDMDLSAVQVSEDPRATTRVLFSDPSLTSSSYRRAVFIDPGSLEVKGDMVQYGSSRSLPLRSWIAEGHRRLWLGDVGRIYSETAASWLGAISIAGAVVWWSRRSHRSATSSSRQRLSRKHTTLGLWLLPGFVFLTITGLTWSLVAGTNISAFRSQLNWVEPKPAVSITNTELHDATADHSVHTHHEAVSGASISDPAQADTVIAAAREAGLTGMIDVNVPPDTDSGWVVKESREAWKLANDAVSVNGETSAVIDTVEFSQWPLAAKLSVWLIQLHMGTLFGWINQLILAVIAFGLIIMICWGYVMWWRRGRGYKPGRLPAAGQWRKASPVARGMIVILLVAYSILAPLFGISLIVFVVLDALYQQLRHRLMMPLTR
ncbi:PepSY-associated TM helix domain-containing protein [Corynebacterium pacaense]|uniref:PepSY-associated TM helix domain-containing protein n=1 Tax=Corynebacterium pacaense TaxID=1816684 RepID=UPI001FE6DF38|nr:PepSY domain-containing protein [Corynebacterium pacaense]